MQQQATSKIRIYLVEDQTLLRETLGSMLRTDPGLELVGEAEDAERALKDLETLDADTVLMDILLPGMDGIEATRRLKEQHPDLAVVVLTSYQGEYFEAAIGAGATGYIMKSCKPEQLVQAVRLACQGHLLIDSTITRSLAREPPDPLEDTGASLPEFALEVERLPKKYNIIFVDAITNLASSSPEQAILGFFSSCKRLCSNGKSMILVAHSSAFDEGMLTRLRSLCDAHLRLYVENVRGKQVRIMEVSKVHNADLATGNVVSFTVEPGIGMRIVPMAQAKA